MRHLARGIWKLVQTKQKLPTGNSIHLGISENVDLSEIPVFRNFIWGDPSSFKGIFWREKDYNHGRVWWNSNHLRSGFQRGSERLTLWIQWSWADVGVPRHLPHNMLMACSLHTALLTPEEKLWVDPQSEMKTYCSDPLLRGQRRVHFGLFRRMCVVLQSSLEFPDSITIRVGLT